MTVQAIPIQDKIEGFALRLAKKAAARMPHRCVVLVAGPDESDKRGHPKTSYTPLPGDPLPCRMDGGLGRAVETVRDNQVTSVQQQRISLVAVRAGVDGPEVISIKAKDRLKVLPHGAVAEQVLD